MNTFITEIEMIFVNYAVPSLYINRDPKYRIYRNPSPGWVEQLVALTYNPNFIHRLYHDGWKITRKGN